MLVASIRTFLEKTPPTTLKKHATEVVSLMLLACLAEILIRPDQVNWAVHRVASQHFMSSHNPYVFKLETAAGRSLVISAWETSFMLALGERQTLTLDSPEWNLALTTAARADNSPDYMQRQFSLFGGIPRVLQNCDAMLQNSGSSVGEAKRCFNDIYLAITATEFYLEHIAPRVPLVPITTPGLLNLAIEEHCVMLGSSSIRDVYLFPDVEAARTLTINRTTLLMLYSALLRIIHQQPLVKFSKRTREYFEARAVEAAGALCKCAYYLSKQYALAWAYFTHHILEVARSHFEEHLATNELGWCQACLIAVNMR